MSEEQPDQSSILQKLFDKTVEQGNQPRFRPGDRVWFMSDNVAFEAEVNSLNQTKTTIEYHMGRGWIDSYKVFATKEELIKSL